MADFFKGIWDFVTGMDVVFKLPLIAVISYLFGSINTSIIVSKVTMKKDIRNYGSGNAGFTNAIRSMGWKKGVLVALGDIAKCAAAILIGQLIYIGDMSFIAGSQGRLLAGLFVFIGHIYPLYFGFRGGKGLLTYGVTMAMFDWRIFLVCISVFIIVVAVTKLVSLGAIIGSLSVPIMVYIISQTSFTEQHMALGYTFAAVFMSALVIFKHRDNIKRLAAGTESKLNFTKKALMEEEEEKSSLSVMAEHFDRLAQGWDPRECDFGTREKIAALAGIREGAVVADLGCGRGVMTPHLLASGPTRLIGVDLSSEMVRLALEDHAGQKAEFICGNALEADLPPLDAAVMYNAYPCFPDKGALARRLSLLIKPGGTFVIAFAAGREGVNRDGAADPLFTPLLPAEKEAVRFSEHFAALTAIDTDEMYFIKLERKLPSSKERAK